MIVFYFTVSLPCPGDRVGKKEVRPRGNFFHHKSQVESSQQGVGPCSNLFTEETKLTEMSSRICIDSNTNRLLTVKRRYVAGSKNVCAECVLVVVILLNLLCHLICINV